MKRTLFGSGVQVLCAALILLASSNAVGFSFRGSIYAALGIATAIEICVWLVALATRYPLKKIGVDADHMTPMTALVLMSIIGAVAAVILVAGARVLPGALSFSAWYGPAVWGLLWVSMALCLSIMDAALFPNEPEVAPVRPSVDDECNCPKAKPPPCCQDKDPQNKP